MGSVAISDVKSLSTKREARSYGKGVIFTKKCGDNTVDLHVQTAGRKYGDEQILYGRLRASSLLASYHRLEKAKLTSC